MYVPSRLRWYALAAYTLIVLALLWSPTVPSPDMEGYDKVGHAILFGTFAWLFWWCFDGEPWMRITWAAAAGFGLGLVSELVQLMVPGRMFEVGDLVADGFGVVMGLSWVMFRAINDAATSLETDRPPVD